jgi:hypothetical protein
VRSWTSPFVCSGSLNPREETDQVRGIGGQDTSSKREGTGRILVTQVCKTGGTPRGGGGTSREAGGEAQPPASPADLSV